MTIEEKYEKYLDLFQKYFIYIGDPNTKGTNIPLESVKFSNKKPVVSTVGDGTINIASYLLYQYLEGKPMWMYFRVLDRLAGAYKKYFEEKFPNVEFSYEPGFFMRDDISSDLCKEFETNFVYSAWTGNIEGLAEDPCFSPVVSQDQIWNLLPIMTFLSRTEMYAIELQKNWLQYVIKHNHTIYDPYISTLMHYWTYLDLSVPYSDRKKVRQEKLKYKVKVKRGANNWYYAYGFRKTYERMPWGEKVNKCVNLLTGMLYYPLTFCAEKIWFPLLHCIVGREPKNNSYYCLASSSGVWFFGKKNFWKTLKKKFYKEGKFQNLFIIETLKRDAWSEVDLNEIEKKLEEYQVPVEIGTMYSPLDYLILYSFYQKAKAKNS